MLCHYSNGWMFERIRPRMTRSSKANAKPKKHTLRAPHSPRTPREPLSAKLPALRKFIAKAKVIQRTERTEALKQLKPLVATIEKGLLAMPESALSVGRALKVIHRDELWRGEEHEGFDAFLAKRGLLSAAYARRLMDIAEALPGAKDVPYAIEKMWELTRYAIDSECKGGVQSLLTEKATIRTESGNQRVRAMSAPQIHAARMKLKSNVSKSAARDPARTSAMDFARRAEKALSKRSKTAVVVTVVKRNGQWQYTVTMDEHTLGAWAEIKEK